MLLGSLLITCSSSFSDVWLWRYPCSKHRIVKLSVLCPSPGCQIRVRVRVITSKSESESESSPQSPSPSPRVRVKKKIRVWVTNLIVHIFNICLSSKTWKQTTKCIECQSKQRNTARPLLLGLERDSGPSHESRFLSQSPSQSEKAGLESKALLESHSIGNYPYWNICYAMFCLFVCLFLYTSSFKIVCNHIEIICYLWVLIQREHLKSSFS